MKTLLSMACAILVAAAISCSPSSDQTSGSDTTSNATADATPVAKQINIIIWNEVGIRATPEEKGKYVTSVYLGEHVDLAGDTASELSGKKRNYYHKVVLADGQEGWVRDEFLAIDVQPAAVMSEAQIFKRPDIATVTEKTFTMSDYVVVKKVDGEFVEVTGKIAGEKWFTTGFVQASNISYADLEVQYSGLKRRAGEETKEKVRNALMTQLANGEMFSASVLWNNDYAIEEEVPLDNGHSDDTEDTEADTTNTDGDVR
jgi:hypothetical protein